jgi:GntR family transcriptional repressor for pyruvate dehydrogenase complex
VRSRTCSRRGGCSSRASPSWPPCARPNQQTIDFQRVRPITGERFVQLDIRFHLAIARATKNGAVVGLMRSLLGGLWIVRQTAMRTLGDYDEAIDIHVRTLKAIMSGDPEVVEVAMDEHLSFLEKHWEEETGRARLRKTPDFLLSSADSA